MKTSSTSPVFLSKLLWVEPSLWKQMSGLGLLEYNLLHCLYTLTPTDIFQLNTSGVINLLYMLSRIGTPMRLNKYNIYKTLKISNINICSFSGCIAHDYL